MVLSSFGAGSGQSFNNNNNLNDNNMGPAPGALDSLTLGQLKQMVSNAPKPKEQLYDYKYEDEDTVMIEIDEFFSYVEAPQVGENLKAWEGSFPGEWIKAPYEQRKRHINVLLESLEHKDAVLRFMNARRLFYCVQGTFAETNSPEHQLHWIIENCKTVRAANGIGIVSEAMKIANHKHDVLSSLSDADSYRLNISLQDKQDLLEEVNTELSIYFGIMYFLVEILKDSDDFAEELMSLEPPLPVYLFNVVAGLREKSFKGYPVKKLLLLLWKITLACCGGSRDLLRVKKIARELAGLPEEDDGPIPIKSSPFDLQTFRQETSAKYPTFVTPPEPPTSFRVSAPTASRPPPERKSGFTISPMKLAEAFSPIPIRHHYHHGDESDFQHQQSHGQHQQQQNQQSGFPSGNPTYNPNPQPLTPMPTPPPSPKPKKQQYQTDQSRPFLFPFSRSQVRGTRGVRLVPDAIEEADMLYNKHMHISVSLFQMWRTREDCMIEESGLYRLSENALETTLDSVLTLNSQGAKGPSGSGSVVSHTEVKVTDDIGDGADELPDVALLNSKIAETETAIKQAQKTANKSRADVKKLKDLRERREDLLRLKRVEMIYAAVLPNLSGWVLVLLKMLLATVSVNNPSQPPPSASSNAFPPGVGSPDQQQPPPPPLTPDEIDLIRHREIMSKSVSAILLLTLRWFKASHAMKFHYLGQLLLESNCLLLILKMFTLQEVSNTVVSKAEIPENNFFQYCLRYSKSPQPERPEDNMLGGAPKPATRTVPKGDKGEEEIEIITEFSWRNFFSSINFVRIMQKLSKHRSHRIWLLVQYKSSAVLKRITKVSHPMLQLYVLKLIKSQVPYCGRKWRSSNMKCITTIYLNCRPDLRDEWLTGSEVDDAQDALAQEQALRKLVKFYNNKRYGSAGAHSMARDNHRRSSSLSMPLGDLHGGPELSAMARPIGTPNIVEADVFPPVRAHAPDPSIFLPYTTEDIAFEEEYEEYLSDLGIGEDYSSSNEGLFGGTSAWHRLPHMGPEIADGISDSESIASIGELGDEAKFDPGPDTDREDENRNNWEHMSPKTMAALPKSPVGPHRRSSSGSSLRPVLPFGLDDNSAVDIEDVEEDEEDIGPMPREQDGPFAQGGGVDEVEYAYGV